MSFGLAIAPISLPTQSRSSFAIFSASSPLGRATFEHDEGAHRLAGKLVGPPDDRRFRDQLAVRDQRGLDLHRAKAVAGDVEHVVDAADDAEIAILIGARAVAGEVAACP